MVIACLSYFVAKAQRKRVLIGRSSIQNSNVKIQNECGAFSLPAAGRRFLNFAFCILIFDFETQ